MFRVFLILLMSQTCFAWTLKSDYKTLPNSKSDLTPQGKQASVLVFRQGKKKVVYTPTQSPLGMVKHEKIFGLKKGQDYFLTTWSNGTSTVFRVFNPNRGPVPLCSKVSLGESAKLQLKDSKLRIQVFKISEKNPEGDFVWLPCGD